MRLSKSLSKKITVIIKDVFGDVDIFLFGSRTDDLRSGGDIDIAIDSWLSANDFKKAKVTLTAQLIKHDLTELSLDITQLSTATGVFKEEIERCKIKLG